MVFILCLLLHEENTYAFTKNTDILDLNWIVTRLLAEHQLQQNL